MILRSGPTNLNSPLSEISTRDWHDMPKVEERKDEQETGVFQGSCRVNRFHHSAFWHSISGRSGLSETAPIGDQSRVSPDHRSGCADLAA